MSPKILNEVQNYKTISKMTIQYLENTKEDMVEEAIKKIRKDNTVEFQLSENDNLKKFTDSILDNDSGHIAWILKDIYKPKQISFSKYNKKTLKNLTPVYCQFYKELQNIAKTIDDKNISKALIGYFNGFIKASC